MNAKIFVLLRRPTLNEHTIAARRVNQEHTVSYSKHPSSEGRQVSESESWEVLI